MEKWRIEKRATVNRQQGMGKSGNEEQGTGNRLNEESLKEGTSKTGNL